MKFGIIFTFLFAVCFICQESDAANQYVYVNKGRLYFPDGKELSLWGVNFQPCLSWEYNQRLKKAGIPLTSPDLKRVTAESLDEIQQMGVNVIRCHLTPVDFTDANGNLVQNVRLDVLDYMVAEASKRNIYVYITLLNHMNSADKSSSFLSGVDPEKRQPMIFDKQMVAKEKHYIIQLLNRTNPYSKQTYKSMDKIALWEILNEPAFSYFTESEFESSPYKNDFISWKGAKKSNADKKELFSEYQDKVVLNFINDMYSTIRSTGAQQPVVWNCNWSSFPKSNKDLIATAAKSRVEVVSFSVYPKQGNENDLSKVDFSNFFAKSYESEDNLKWTLSSAFKDKAKVVYEYDANRSQNSTTYPIEALLFRSLGAQSATMWTYSLAESAPYISGDHFLNLTCTPAKAASFVVAHQLFTNTPLYTPFDTKSVNEQISEDFAISKAHDLSLFASSDKLCYTGDITAWCPVKISNSVTEIAGRGNSPLVSYNGTGMYFIKEKDNDLFITLEPNSMWLSDPWLRNKKAQLVTELDYTASNILTIMLNRWNKGPFILYRILNGERLKMKELSTLKEITITPGNYVIVRE